MTAAYFASEDLTILRANKNFATFFPILANVENVSFLDILDQLGVDHRLLSVKFQGLDHRLTGVEEAKVIDDILA